MSVLSPDPRLAVAAAVALLTMGRGDVLNARSEECPDAERLFRQSWVLMTREPSTHMIDATTDEVTEGKLGKLAVKPGIVDGWDCDAELEPKVSAIAQIVFMVGLPFPRYVKQSEHSRIANLSKIR